MKLTHFSSKQVIEVLSRQQTYPGVQNHRHDKPIGLWVSVDGEYSWDKWCVDNDFGNLDFAHNVVLSPNAKILHLSSALNIDEFTKEYGYHPKPSLVFFTAIDWARVAAEYQGIIISPYLWERRLHDFTNWYYGWDCASGCIWDATAIQSITLLKDYVPAYEKDLETSIIR